MALVIHECLPNDEEVKVLLSALSNKLFRIMGNDGRASFSEDDVQGIGSEILHRLEKYAQEYGYKEIWLETRKVNENAVRFYLQQGYRVRSNYGKYVDRSEAVCFEKGIAEK